MIRVSAGGLGWGSVGVDRPGDGYALRTSRDIVACFIEFQRPDSCIMSPQAVRDVPLCDSEAMKEKTGHCPFRQEAKRSSAWLLFGD